jgi:hypothetical protein
MFYNFNAHRRPQHSVKQDLLARKIFDKIILIQRKWANYMDRKLRRLSLGGIKVLCLTVLLATGFYSLYLLADGFCSLYSFEIPSEISRLWPVEPQRTPRRLLLRAQFRLYLDSLEKSVVQDSLNQLNQKQK